MINLEEEIAKHQQIVSISYKRSYIPECPKARAEFDAADDWMIGEDLKDGWFAQKQVRWYKL